MANENKVVEIHISEVMFWIGLATLITIMAWWVLGDSPTTEIIGLTLSFAGVLFGWRAGEDVKIIKENTFKTLELQQKSVELQNKTLEKLER